jgi:hypothetical protein
MSIVGGESKTVNSNMSGRSCSDTIVLNLLENANN